MSNFMEKIREEQSRTLTENGMETYSTSMSALVDFFGSGGAVRTRTEEDQLSLFTKAFAEDKLLAIKTLFYLRDCRGGVGERKLFNICLRWLGNNYTDIIKANIHNISEYGRYDDLFSLFGTKSEKVVVNFIKQQLNADITNLRKGGNITLLAKWLKSENTSSFNSRYIATKTRKALGLTSQQYRKTLSILRAKLKLTEVAMSAGKWDVIDYEEVPSKAALVYRKAFEKHDADRYNAYLDSVAKGEKKVNASVLFPYELLKSYYVGSSWSDNNHTWRSSADTLIEEQWKVLPDYFNGNSENSLCIVDTSGSMEGLPILVAVSLGIYAAERNTGEFHNYFMSFSTNPQLHKLQGNTLLEKSSNLTKTAWSGSTDLIKAFDLILNVAVKNSIPEDEMVRKLYIISDMEFNGHVSGGTAMENIRRKYASAGYKCPDVVFWNVNARNDNFPVRSNEYGVALVSGCSPAIFKNVLGKNDLSPVGIMLETINSDRYKNVVI